MKQLHYEEHQNVHSSVSIVLVITYRLLWGLRAWHGLEKWDKHVTFCLKNPNGWDRPLDHAAGNNKMCLVCIWRGQNFLAKGEVNITDIVMVSGSPNLLCNIFITCATAIKKLSKKAIFFITITGIDSSIFPINARKLQVLVAFLTAYIYTDKPPLLPCLCPS